MERLRPGVSVFEVPGRGSALREASGRLRGGALPRGTVEALTRWFAGADPTPPPGLDPERGAFAAAGYLDDTRPARTATVTVAASAGVPDRSSRTHRWLRGPWAITPTCHRARPILVAVARRFHSPSCGLPLPPLLHG